MDATIDEPPRHGHFEVAARLGYAHPMGELVNQSDLHQSFSAQALSQIDAGYRFPSGIVLGPYLSYGFVGVKDGSPVCPPSWTRCAGHDVRFGLQMLFDLRGRVARSVSPWFGFGFGREWLTYRASLDQANGTLTDQVTFGGWEVGMQFGVDFTVAPTVGLGPFIGVTVATFDELTAERSGIVTVPSTTLTPSTSFHHWALIGVRGKLELL